MNISFGNLKRNHKPMIVGSLEKTKFLVNVGHMDENSPIEDEKEKVKIAFKNDFDIIADNSITKKSYDFRAWITDTYSIKLNTVPIYECFEAMQENSFDIDLLYKTIERHINYLSDMIVVHPGLTRNLVKKIHHSKRVISVTSRGGAQIFSYIKKTDKENPYYQYWDEILKIIKGTGVALAIGLTLRAGSIIDELDELYLEEMDVCGDLISKALDLEIPVVIEGVGHISINSLSKLLKEIKTRCCDVPIKTLGPIGSDRLCGYDDINALICSAIASQNGVSIIGALLKSEHLGLPSIEDYENGLINYRILKYLLNLDSDDINHEYSISVARRERCWNRMFCEALYPEIAKEQYLLHNKSHKDICTMCGERCALKLGSTDLL